LVVVKYVFNSGGVVVWLNCLLGEFLVPVGPWWKKTKTTFRRQQQKLQETVCTSNKAVLFRTE
jgi:hypothetical protein